MGAPDTQLTTTKQAALAREAMMCSVSDEGRLFFFFPLLGPVSPFDTPPPPQTAVVSSQSRTKQIVASPRASREELYFTCKTTQVLS